MRVLGQITEYEGVRMEAAYLNNVTLYSGRHCATLSTRLVS